ncbi:peptide-methionine (S)-S-oxide reductase MsrA [Halomonas sp. WWR20]
MRSALTAVMVTCSLLGLSAPVSADEAVATFAGGCFWCMEPPYDKLDGVKSTISGYTGGGVDNPRYEQVSAGNTGHTEAVKVVYDPQVIDYATLLEVFWHNIDPFAENRQFCDAGSQYRSAIFTHDEEQRRLAEQSKTAFEQRFGRDIATQIEPAGEFWEAEDYHQDFYQKNPVRYRFYRAGCGRDERLEEIWGNEAGH